MAKGKKRSAGPGRLSPPVRVSYAQGLFNAKTYEDGKSSFGATFMFEKTDKAHMDYLKTLAADAKACLAEYWPKESERPRIPVVGADTSPIKDADKALDKSGIPLLESNPEYAGHYIVRVSAYDKPDVRLRDKRTPATEKQVYSGCRVRVNLNAYTFDNRSKGVTFGMNGVMFWADDESLGGGGQPFEKAFEEVEDDLSAIPGEDPNAYFEEENDVPF
jgi:hypothetical protein